MPAFPIFLMTPETRQLANRVMEEIPTVSGIIIGIINMKTFQPEKYWDQGEFWAEFDSETRPEYPRIYRSMQGLLKCIDRLNCAYPNLLNEGKKIELLFWIHRLLGKETLPFRGGMNCPPFKLNNNSFQIIKGFLGILSIIYEV